MIEEQGEGLVEVTQADRDMAALVAWKSPSFLRELKEGLHDDSDAAQAFARHRIASERAIIPVVLESLHSPEVAETLCRAYDSEFADEDMPYQSKAIVRMGEAIRNLGSSPGGMGE